MHQELKSGLWQHSHYTAFNVCDPKLRRIHKACIRDRVLYHAVFRVLYQVFDKGFIFDSYSCRLDKGTHKAVDRLERFCRQTSHNNSHNLFALKCDVRRFFDSVDQDILLKLINRKIQDQDALCLIGKIIKSFEKSPGKGLPLGNVTSQLFASVYLNEFDQFVKYHLRARYYSRYCDDFVLLGEDKKCLSDLIPSIIGFLEQKLKLSLHPDKIIVRKHRQGIDWLGYVVLPRYRVLRTKTKKRMLRKIKSKRENFDKGLIAEKSFYQSWQSYLGVLKHCRGYKIEQKIKNNL